MITTSTTSHLEKKKKKQQQQHCWEASTAFPNYLNFYILIPVVYSLDLISTYVIATKRLTHLPTYTVSNYIHYLLIYNAHPLT
jgi:hypothetical protein